MAAPIQKIQWVAGPGRSPIESIEWPTQFKRLFKRIKRRAADRLLNGRAHSKDAGPIQKTRARPPFECPPPFKRIKRWAGRPAGSFECPPHSIDSKGGPVGPPGVFFFETRNPPNIQKNQKNQKGIAPTRVLATLGEYKSKD